MQCACTTHTTHHFVEDQERSVFVADSAHCFEVTPDCWDTSQSLCQSVSIKYLDRITYSTDYRLGDKGAYCVRTDALELIVKFFR